jgi:hypothetical protein
MLSAKGGVAMTPINCLTIVLVATLAAACFGAGTMAVFQINRARADIIDTREVLTDTIEADILQRLKTAQFELRLISQDDPNAPDLRSVIARLQDAILTIQLKS